MRVTLHFPLCDEDGGILDCREDERLLDPQAETALMAATMAQADPHDMADPY